MNQQQNFDPEMDQKLLQLKSTLQRLGRLPDDTWQAFREQLYIQKFDKNYKLTVPGKVEDKIYFILDGAVRVFVERNHKEISTNFRFDHQFTSSISSFIIKAPSRYTLKTLEPTEVIVIDRDHLYWMYENYSDFNSLGRAVMEYLLIEKRERELDFLTLSAEERYLKMVEEYPNYIRNISLKHLASFMGIAPASLSRIRAKVMD